MSPGWITKGLLKIEQMVNTPLENRIRRHPKSDIFKKKKTKKPLHLTHYDYQWSDLATNWETLYIKPYLSSRMITQENKEKLGQSWQCNNNSRSDLRLHSLWTDLHVLINHQCACIKCGWIPLLNFISEVKPRWEKTD